MWCHSLWVGAWLDVCVYIDCAMRHCGTSADWRRKVRWRMWQSGVVQWGGKDLRLNREQDVGRRKNGERAYLFPLSRYTPRWDYILSERIATHAKLPERLV